MALDFLLAGCDEAERHARLRELRVLTAIFTGGANSPATTILTAAVKGEITASEALPALDLIPSLPKRRILAVFGELTWPKQRGK